MSPRAGSQPEGSAPGQENQLIPTWPLLSEKEGKPWKPVHAYDDVRLLPACEKQPLFCQKCHNNRLEFLHRLSIFTVLKVP